MQFSFAAVLALATAVFAQERAPLPNPAFNPVTSPTQHQKVEAGSVLNIKWTVAPEFASTKVNLILIGGPEQNLQTPLLRIVDGLDNSKGEYAWTVPADQGGFDWYGITIEDVADTVNNYQFSPPFDIEKNPTAAASGTDATSTVTITTASGTATVTLSSAAITTTAVSSSAVETSEVSSALETSSAVTTSSAAPTTLVVLPTTTSASVVAAASSSTSTSPDAAETSLALVGENAGVQAKAGVFAVLGGLAVALLM